jgi:hypothetical protein
VIDGGSCTPWATEPILQIFALDLCGVGIHQRKSGQLATRSDKKHTVRTAVDVR